MSRTGRRRAWTTLVVALALLLGSPLLSWAHIDPPSPLPLDPVSQDEYHTPRPWLPSIQSMLPVIPRASLIFMGFLLASFALAQGMWQWRRAMALGLVFVLGFFTFGIAVHAVHHLDEPERASECPVFSASQHVTGTPGETCDLYVPALAIAGLSIVRFDAPTLAPYFHPAQPRAPPSRPT
jgi:hypothetical protein